MRFDRVSLRNFKCYEDATVSLDRGVTVIHGINGSGKSSLLEACFFALYGATALDRTLEEIVTIGEEEAEIDLWFTHEGASYHLNRRIRATGDRATTADCVLDGPNETIDGVGDVEARIVSMLRMDSDAFVNSAFVRQGEINKLINATPAERQRMIDRLLQLGKLETYRERAAEGRLGIESLLDQWRAGRLESIDEQIAEKESKDLHERRAALETEIADLEDTIDRYRANRDEATETLSEATSLLETYEERKAELETVEERVSDLRETIAAAESRRSDLGEQVATHREQLAELDERIEAQAAEVDIDAPDIETVEAEIEDCRAEKERLHEEIMDLRETVQSHSNDAERARERAAEYRDQIEEKRDRLESLESDLEDLEETIESGSEAVAELEAEIEAHREQFDGEIEFGDATERLEALESDLADLREEETEIREALATARSRVTEAEELLEAGKCPECGQPVDDSPHVESLDSYREAVTEHEAALEAVLERRESLESDIEAVAELESAEQAVDSLETRLESKRERLEEKREAKSRTEERIADLEETIEDLVESVEAAEEAASEAEAAIEEVRPDIGERNQERSDITERIDSLQELRETIADRNETQETIERLQEDRETIAEQNEERREHLEAARERKQTLEDDVDEARIEEARSEKRNAEQYLEEVKRILGEKQDERDERQNELGAVENELSELETLRSQRESVEATVENLESLHEEATELESMYGDLRAELRQQNVSRLERLLNETFDLVYQNDSYARIELSGQYELTVFQKDGEPLDPDQLSGGERALFNLSLRTAIYRLLAEGIDGAAPMPPLILDEPTVFLDSGHVSQLVTLVDTMRRLGVEQIIVVSHDDELIGAADDVIHVVKDATSNRSHIEDMPLLDAD